MASAVLEHELETLEWVGVDSSNLDAVAYAPDFGRLWVRFKAGTVYVFPKIPPDVYAALLSAPSKGGYFAANVRDGRHGGYEQVR